MGTLLGAEDISAVLLLAQVLVVLSSRCWRYVEADLLLLEKLEVSIVMILMMAFPRRFLLLLMRPNR